ncbi:hypothetical protein OUZ56_006514 [Daphnia magna]|uniref:Uncharacterized protein n=1 Tax=Daphnia magna TaxID=35525 RepID=A0ABQ9YVW4_9CRUS|nr:hypothetical protein OUZ56_006514 [Daphnia magna]
MPSPSFRLSIVHHHHLCRKIAVQFKSSNHASLRIYHVFYFSPSKSRVSQPQFGKVTEKPFFLSVSAMIVNMVSFRYDRLMLCHSLRFSY